MDGYISLPVQARIGDGPVANVTTVATVCERCGYLAQHVADVLLSSEIDSLPGAAGASGAPDGPGASSDTGSNGAAPE